MRRRKPHSVLLALTMIPGLGNQRIRKIVDEFPDVTRVFDAGIDVLEEIDGIGPVTARQIRQFQNWQGVDRILSRTARCRSTLVSILDDEYPPGLVELYDAPPLLWVKGSTRPLTTPGIAVVGTRRPDHYGLEQAQAWSAELARSGLSIISGLAYGIDTVAHQTALRNNALTTAVFGCGVDFIYPKSNRKLAASIVDNGGSLVSEYPPGTEPEPGNFPRRNRLVSGLCLGVLIVQSGLRGGSMITARSALDQNREVFIIPHSLDNPSGIGCNELIMRGEGKLVRTIGDLLDELPPIELSQHGSGGVSPVSSPGLTESRGAIESLESEELQICSLLENGPVQLDVLEKRVGIPSGDLLPVLLTLELNGYIKQKAGKYFELA